jgi:hypothetical protein
MILTSMELSHEGYLRLSDKFWVGHGDGLLVLVVAGSDACNALHAAGVPELNNKKNVFDFHRIIK